MKSSVESLSSLIASIALAVRGHRTRRRLSLGHKPHPSGPDSVIGGSSGIRQIRHIVAILAPLNVNICIHGERGVGKTLVARAIHGRGRPGRPLLVLDCAASLANVGEEAAFWYLWSALQLARTGTLVLKDVSALSLLLQATLREAIHTNVRIIATTKEDLEAMVWRGALRADLFHELAAFTFMLPPLRTRREDIPLLVEHFVHSFNAQHPSKQIRGVTAQALQFFLAYDWPGNVQELQWCVGRAADTTEGEEIGLADLPLSKMGRELVLDCAAQVREDYVVPLTWLSICLESLHSGLKRQRMGIPS